MLASAAAVVVCLGAWQVTGMASGDQRAEPSVPSPTAAPSSPGTAAVPAVATGRPRSTAPPVELEIPAIDLSTRVVRLGLQEDRTVEVPAPDRAGWFEPGTAPGATGSAVVLGHVDSTDGPAVFARLDELGRGDVVRVARSDGSVLRFEVVRSVLYRNADFPAQQVYAAPTGRRLNLVTCGGEYDASRGGYQSNLVVYTRLVG